MSLTVAQREALQEQRDSIEAYVMTFGSLTFFFTSYFMPVTIGGQVYEAIPVEREGMAFASDLSDVNTTLSLPINTDVGALFVGDSQINTCTLEIRKYFLADLTEYDVVFAGYIKKPTVDKGVLKLECGSWLDDLSRDFPRIRMQASCNNILFDSQCTLTAATFKITGTVTHVDGINVTVTYTLSGYPLTPTTGFFVGGRCVKTGGTDIRAIVADTAGVSGAFLTLHYPINGLAVSDTLDLYPGCNKTFDVSGTCPNSCTTFGNTANYLGMTRIPYKNPTITPIS